MNAGSIDIMGLSSTTIRLDPEWSVGLMTGTVLDGNIDVALLKTDGKRIHEFGTYTLTPYSPDTVELLRETVAQALDWQFCGDEPVIFAEAEKQLTIEQSDAVGILVEQAGLSMNEVGVVGFHGQTVLHRPPSNGVFGNTRQLGDGALMSRLLGVNVVHDFRSADMRVGGQGAPLASIYHQALLREQGCSGETAVLNLGGVANLTWWDGDQQLVGFDTGPANAPINDFVRSMGLGNFDVDGKLAASGVVDEKRLIDLLCHPYLTMPYPKSLDRFDFSCDMADGLVASDGAALLAAFSAGAVNKALELLPQRPVRLVVCGGGRHNPSLMQALRDRTGAEVIAAEAIGWRGDAVEAECFAFLAVRSLRGLPNSFPETTGVPVPTCGGVVHWANLTSRV